MLGFKYKQNKVYFLKICIDEHDQAEVLEVTGWIRLLATSWPTINWKKTLIWRWACYTTATCNLGTFVLPRSLVKEQTLFDFCCKIVDKNQAGATRVFISHTCLIDGITTLIPFKPRTDKITSPPLLDRARLNFKVTTKSSYFCKFSSYIFSYWALWEKLCLASLQK